MPTNVYVLRLRHGKYYVGKTSDPASRIRSHFQGYGSAWTQMHPPIGLIEVRENVSNFEEDLVTQEYMHRYGWQNVRGGRTVTPTCAEKTWAMKGVKCSERPIDACGAAAMVTGPVTASPDRVC
jgi:predicted GIY-YIG superfamily endonuclease